MNYLDYKTQYPKETYEVGYALGEMIRAIGAALKDGFQPGQDIPVIITSAIANLASAINGLDELPEEFVQEPVKAAVAIIAPLGDGVQDLLKSLKKEEN